MASTMGNSEAAMNSWRDFQTNQYKFQQKKSHSLFYVGSFCINFRFRFSLKTNNTDPTPYFLFEILKVKENTEFKPQKDGIKATGGHF